MYEVLLRKIYAGNWKGKDAHGRELQQVQDTTQAQGVAGEEGNNNETTTEQTTTPLVPTARIASAPLDVNRPKAIRTGGVARKSSVDDLLKSPTDYVMSPISRKLYGKKEKPRAFAPDELSPEKPAVLVHSEKSASRFKPSE
ncbi:hypothetical protein RI054_25g107610 [Pseudoscourfieldia marina]